MERPQAALNRLYDSSTPASLAAAQLQHMRLCLLHNHTCLQPIAVIGGGDSAMEEATFLTKWVCSLLLCVPPCTPLLAATCCAKKRT